MKRAVIKVTPELLIQVLSLPPGTKAVTYEPMEFVVEHDGLKESDVVLDALPAFARDADGVVTFVGWGQP